jgi:hypothetical protein
MGQRVSCVLRVCLCVVVLAGSSCCGCPLAAAAALSIRGSLVSACFGWRLAAPVCLAGVPATHTSACSWLTGWFSSVGMFCACAVCDQVKCGGGLWVGFDRGRSGRVGVCLCCMAVHAEMNHAVMLWLLGWLADGWSLLPAACDRRRGAVRRDARLPPVKWCKFGVRGEALGAKHHLALSCSLPSSHTHSPLDTHDTTPVAARSPAAREFASRAPAAALILNSCSLIPTHSLPILKQQLLTTCRLAARSAWATLRPHTTGAAAAR